MKFHKRSLLYLIAIFVLAVVHLSSCRHISKAASEGGTEQTQRAEFSYLFSSRLGPGSHPAEIGDRINQVNTVSNKVVPVGPNPLHN